jgi:hypothetical protein
MACVERTPRSPGQNLAAEVLGVCIINSSLSLSNVAVVSSPLTLEPCPSSV